MLSIRLGVSSITEAVVEQDLEVSQAAMRTTAPNLAPIAYFMT